MARIIASVNQKGGVGKTTITMNLGIGLARAGQKVLLIDFDPQGSLTDCLGFPEPDEMDVTSASLMMDCINDENHGAGYGILKHQEGIYLLPGNIDLSGLEVTLVNVMCREMILKRYLARLSNFYDYILIDCMASLGTLTINALAAADSVLIPLMAEKPSIRGLQQLLKTIGMVRRNMNPELQIEGIVPNKVDERTNYNKGIVRQLREVYDGPLKVFDCIPQSIRVAETAAQGVSIFTYDPSGNGAKAYQSLVDKILEENAI